MKALLPSLLVSVACLATLSCGAPTNQPDQTTIGVAFETLQTEYWVASLDAMKAELAKHDVRVLEAVADGDPNRQLEQVQSFIARKVDGIIVVPKDAESVIPMIRAANKANIPIVLYNRGPGEGAGPCVTVVADNRAITRDTVRRMIASASERSKPMQGMILIGDLGDINAIERREGFDEAISESNGAVEVVARVPTVWNQEKALAGVTNALQANPDIEFIFSSSDFLFPSIVAALKNADKYHPIGHERHVVLGGFDGDATAYRMLQDKYLDADGVQNVYFECSQAVDAVLKMSRGETVEPVLKDQGVVIHQDNLDQESHRMWGAQVAAKQP